MRTFQDDVIPNLLRHFFPTYRVPRINFSEGSLPTRVPGEAWCVDTTLGLGLCAVDALTARDVVNLYATLNLINGKSGLIRQAEVAVGGEVEREALTTIVHKVQDGDFDVTPVAVMDASAAQMKLAKGLGIREVGIQFGASDYLVVGEKKGSRTDKVKGLLAVIDAGLDEFQRFRLDLLDITRADVEGFVLPLIEDVRDHLSHTSGTRLRVRLVDSLGLGVPWTEAPVPRSVPRLIHTIGHHADLSGEQLEFAAFDDMGLAVANTAAAMVHGTAGLVTSLGGVGDRSGLGATELMLLFLSGQYGVELNLQAVADALAMLAEHGAEVGARHPIWGERALLRRHAPHARAVDVTHDLHGPMDTERLLNLRGDVEVRPENGAAGLVHLLRHHHPRARLSCDAEAVVAIMAWIQDQGLTRYTYADVVKKAYDLIPELFDDDYDWDQYGKAPEVEEEAGEEDEAAAGATEGAPGEAETEEQAAQPAGTEAPPAQAGEAGEQATQPAEAAQDRDAPAATAEEEPAQG